MSGGRRGGPLPRPPPVGRREFDSGGFRWGGGGGLLGSFDFSAPGSAPAKGEDQEAGLEVRSVLGRFASGVTIVTARGADGGA